MDYLAFEHERSPSGADVFVKTLPHHAPNLVHVRAFIGSGSREDPAGKEGLAHRHEHSSRRGTRRWPSHRDIQEVDFDLCLESLDAETDMDYTCFQVAPAPSDLYEAMLVLQDVVFYPRLDAERFAREQKIVLCEMREGFVSRGRVRLMRGLRQDLYDGHPFGRMNEPDGWVESVESLTLEDLHQFHAEHYRAGNTKLVFTGAVRMAEALQAAEIFLPGRDPRPPRPRAEPMREAPPPRRNERRISTLQWFGTREVEATELKGYRLLPGTAPIQLVWLLRHMLRALLQEVRGEESSSYGVSVHLHTYEDHHLLEIHGSIDPDSVERTLDRIRELLAGFARGEHEEQFRRTQIRMLKRSDDRIDLNVAGTADYAVRDLARFGRIIPVAESKTAIAGLEYEEAAALAARELSPDKFLWLIVTP